MKRLTLTVIISAAVIAGLIGLATFALTIIEEPKVDIVDRHSSPDAELEAIHVMPETGATDGFVDWIYVVKAGDSPSGKPAFVADGVDGGIAIGWSNNAEITVNAKAARIFRSEPVTVSLPGDKTRQVTIRLNIADVRRP